MILWKVWTPTQGVVYDLPDDVPDWVEEKASSNGVVDGQLRFSF
jgi:hypothetical protein